MLALVGGDELRGLLPIWEFSLGETLIRRRLVLVHGENTLFVNYQNHGAVEARIQLRPFCTFRSHDRPIATLRGHFLVPGEA